MSSSLKKVRFGVLGCADIAKRFMCDAIRSTPHSQLRGVASRDPARASQFAQQFDTAVFSSYEELLRSPEIDAVYIPLPVGLHEAWARKSLEAGKHVLSEKSLTGSGKSSENLVRLARERGLLLFDNFMCRFHPQNLFLRDRIQSGAFGKIRNIELNFGIPPLSQGNIRYSRELQGGALNDVGAYCVKMASFYLGKRPVSCAGIAETEGHEVDVRGTAVLRYPDSVHAVIQYGFQNDYRNEVCIWGEQATVKLERCFTCPPDWSPRISMKRNQQVEEIQLEPANHFHEIVRNFSKWILGGQGFGAQLDEVLEHAQDLELVRSSILR